MMKKILLPIIIFSILSYTNTGICDGTDYLLADLVRDEYIKTATDVAYYLYTNIEYIPDPVSHGVDEYWQTPLETLELGTGDCEDISLLGQALLKQIGIEDATLVLIYYNFEEVGHACVIFKLDEETWGILDDIIWEVSKERYATVSAIVRDWYGAELMDIRIGKGQ